MRKKQVDVTLERFLMCAESEHSKLYAAEKYHGFVDFASEIFRVDANLKVNSPKNWKNARQINVFSLNSGVFHGMVCAQQTFIKWH